MKRQLFRLFIGIAACLFLTSCGFKDIDKRIFVQAIGVDYSNNEKQPYKVTLKLAVPSGSLKEAETKYAYISKEDSSMAEAIRFLKSHEDKELDFGHAKVIVLGENILERDLHEMLDFFFRRRDIQMISWVAVGNPSAEKVLKVHPKSEMSGTFALSNFFSNNGVESAYIVSSFLFDARRRIVESGIDPILPIIETGNKSKLKVNQSVVFSGVKKTRTIQLSPKQTKLYNLLANNTSKMEIEVGKMEENFTMSVDTAKVRYKIITSGRKPVLKMDIRIGGIIEESSFDMSPKNLDKYSSQAGKHTKKEILKLLTLFQEKNVDPLGFGLRYKATKLNNGKRFDEWKKIYPDLTFDVSVDASIKSTGAIE